MEYFALSALLLLAVFSLFTKNVRYLAILELPFALSAVSFVFDRVRDRSRAFAWSVGGSAVALLCLTDALTFREFFLVNELYDPVSAALFGLRHITSFKLHR